MEVRPIETAALPHEVAGAPPRERQAYAAALDFEALLVRQLSSALVTSAQDEDDAGAAATGVYGGMVADALVDGITSAGGLGLAPALARSFAEPSAS